MAGSSAPATSGTSMDAWNPRSARRWPTRRAGVAFVTARAAERDFLALARVESLVIGGRTFTLVGGVAVDEAFLARLARGRAIIVSLLYPGGGISSDPATKLDGESTPAAGGADADVRELQVPLIRSRLGGTARSRSGQAADDSVAGAADERSCATWIRGSWQPPRGPGPPRCCWRCGCRRASADRWPRWPRRPPCSTSIASTSAFDAGTDEVGTLSRVLGDLAASTAGQHRSSA